MIHRIAILALSATLLVAARPAQAALSLEVNYGIARPPAGGLKEAVSSAMNEANLFDSSLRAAGGTVLLNLGLLTLGAVVDTTRQTGSPTQTALGGLLGFRVGDQFRLDLLGEVGGHRYGDFLENPDVITASSKEEWLFYVGLRTGMAYRLELFPKGPGLLMGLWGFARWDVKSKDLPVTIAGAGGAITDGTLKLGGTSVGAIHRAGIEF